MLTALPALLALASGVGTTEIVIAGVSAFNVGNAAGPFLGGRAVGAGYGYSSIVWAAVPLSALGLGRALGLGCALLPGAVARRRTSLR
ncbi:hypothetical protein [Streptosporangium sp. NBC_01756]|uniref:hypothetical protein n=1 Tax=Streptosporangium sp. NBC_01756 TaxID=2975950 RepID=UPI002DDB9F22|nr:hypothetical protein [Streptosporangium sp. NBC_01756]WSC84011.1 hypothetical protein OIE48_26915 [Streptosporangium sp. NBC_01756]